RGATNVTSILRVTHQTINANDHRFLHLVGNYRSNFLRAVRASGTPVSAVRRSRLDEIVFSGRRIARGAAAIAFFLVLFSHSSHSVAGGRRFDRAFPTRAGFSAGAHNS